MCGIIYDLCGNNSYYCHGYAMVGGNGVLGWGEGVVFASSLEDKCLVCG